MQLSATEFSDVLKTVDPLQKQEPGHNMRRAARVTIRARISIAACNDTQREAPTIVSVRDLSVRGIGFLHDKLLPVGQQLIVYLNRKNEEPLAVLCGVVHCRTLEENLHSIGAEFICPVPPTQTPTPNADSEADDIRKSMFS